MCVVDYPMRRISNTAYFKVGDAGIFVPLKTDCRVQLRLG